MEFYNVKKREKVEIADSKCVKVIYDRKTAKGVQKRYAVQAKDPTDGISLTKFITKDAYDALTCKAKAK